MKGQRLPTNPKGEIVESNGCIYVGFVVNSVPKLKGSDFEKCSQFLEKGVLRFDDSFLTCLSMLLWH